MKATDLHHKDHSIQLFTDASNEGWDSHLEQVLLKVCGQKKNSLSRDVCTPVEHHDLVPSLPHNIESQAHSRLSQCDDRPPVQVPPSSVDRMVFLSTVFQANMPKVVHSSCRSVCHSSESQTPSLCVSYPRPTGLGHRYSNLNWTGLTAYVYPPTALLYRVI